MRHANTRVCACVCVRVRQVAPYLYACYLRCLQWHTRAWQQRQLQGFLEHIARVLLARAASMLIRQVCTDRQTDTRTD